MGKWGALRKTQIHTWFNNASNVAKRAKPRVEIKIDSKVRCVPCESQVYSSLNKASSALQANVDWEMRERNLSGVHRLLVFNGIARAHYENEDDDMRDQLRVERQRLKDQADAINKAEKGMLEEKLANAYSNTERMAAVDCLPDTMAGFAEQMGPRTGWNFTLIGGGPDPKDPEGRITTMAFHYGTTPQGYSFLKVNLGVVKLLLREYSVFCHLVTSFEECIFRAHNLTEDTLEMQRVVAKEQGVPVVPDVQSAPILDDGGDFNEEIVTVYKASEEGGGKRGKRGKSKKGGKASNHASSTLAAAEHAATVGEIPTSTVVHQQDVIGVGESQAAVGVYQQHATGVGGPSTLAAGSEHGGTVDGESSDGAWDFSWMQEFTPELLLAAGERDPHVPAQIPAWMGNGESINGQLDINQEPEMGGEGGTAGTVLHLPLAQDKNDRPALLPAGERVLHVPVEIPAWMGNGESSNRQLDSNREPGTGGKGGTVGTVLHLPLAQDKNDQAARGAGEGGQGEGETAGTAVQDENDQPTRGAAKRPHEATADGDNAEHGRVRRPRREICKAPGAWMVAAKTYLFSDLDNEAWTQAVDAWITFELGLTADTSGFCMPAMQHRPKQVKDWAATHRYNAMPDLGDEDAVKEFADGWLNWWKWMQPHPCKFSYKDNLPAPLEAKHDLSGIRKGGKAGIVNVLVSLKWWVNENDPRWNAAVADILACLKHPLHAREIILVEIFKK